MVYIPSILMTIWEWFMAWGLTLNLNNMDFPLDCPTPRSHFFFEAKGWATILSSTSVPVVAAAICVNLCSAWAALCPTQPFLWKDTEKAPVRRNSSDLPNNCWTTSTGVRPAASLCIAVPKRKSTGIHVVGKSNMLWPVQYRTCSHVSCQSANLVSSWWPWINHLYMFFFQALQKRMQILSWTVYFSMYCNEM